VTDDGIGGMTGQPDRGFVPSDGMWPHGLGGEYDADMAPEPVRLPADGDTVGQWAIPFVVEDAADESGEYSLGVPVADLVAPAGDPARPAPSVDGSADGSADDLADGPAEGRPSEHPTASYVLHVNGVDRPVTGAWLGESLLYVLRERLGLAGAKDGCEQGECGACSVRVDGRLIASCLTPAATAAGCEILTVEGLGCDGRPSDVQCALSASSAVQCGFCLPGMAMAIHDLLEGNHEPSELETRQALSGNLCRCSGYRGVLHAVRDVVATRQASVPADADAADVPQDAADDQHDQQDTEAARIPHQGAPPPTADGESTGWADGGMA
jgi:aerobic-type carbon monoxide dehydrogenase small subunit (CoxS/CutS family)